MLGRLEFGCRVGIENVLINEQGRKVALKEGAKVDVTVSADPEATVPST